MSSVVHAEMTLANMRLKELRKELAKAEAEEDAKVRFYPLTPLLPCTPPS